MAQHSHNLISSQAEHRILRAGERISMNSALLLGWELLIAEHGAKVFNEALYEFIPAFLAIAKGAARAWQDSDQLVVLYPAKTDGKAQKKLAAFPTITLGDESDMLIDTQFVNLMETRLKDIAYNPRPFLSPVDVNKYYYAAFDRFTELLEKTFVAFCLGFDLLQPYEGQGRVINETEKERAGRIGGGRHLRMKWFNKTSPHYIPD